MYVAILGGFSMLAELCMISANALQTCQQASYHVRTNSNSQFLKSTPCRISRFSHKKSPAITSQAPYYSPPDFSTPMSALPDTLRHYSTLRDTARHSAIQY